jgi:pilus assembly protein FimV
MSSAVEAAGLGRMSVLSGMGQPLRAEIELLSVPAEDMAGVEAKLASPEAFRQARMDRSSILGDLQLTLERRSNGQPVVRITSASPVTDPFVDLLIELNWSSGRILREYTVLLDPVRDAKPVAEAPKPVLPAVGEPAPRATAPTPQAMPPSAQAKPVAPKAPAAAPAPAKLRTYGPVKSGETLHAIAKKVMPADVSLEMMVASLYQANKSAFAQNNVNLLKQGQVLTVPDRDSVMLMVSPHQARKLLSEHSTAWNELRGRVASQAARSVAEAAPDDASKGKIVRAQPQEKPAPAAVSKDVLKLSKGEPAKATDAKAAQKVQALEEELAAKNRALQEAHDRVSQLERTVQDLQRLMDLKTKDGAQPPAPAAEAKPEPAAAPPAKPEPAQAKPPVEMPVQEPGILDTLLSTPLYIGGLVAAAVLAVLLWVFMVGSRRRKGLSDFEQSVMTGGDPFKTSIFKTTTGMPTERGAPSQAGAATDFSRLGLGSIDTHEVDPIAEAEVYMAYGRDAQAEEILKEALGKDPNRHEIALKLLEIYATRQDTATFETQASELYANLGDPASAIWQQAADMGRKLDPANPLYRVFGEAPDLPEVPAVPEVPAAPVVAEIAPVEESRPAEEPLVFDVPVELQAMPEPVAEPDVDATVRLEDMHFDVTPLELPGMTEPAPEPAQEYPSFGVAMEPDLGQLDEIQLAPTDEEASLELPEELDLVDLTAAAPATEAKAAEPDEVRLPDLDFSGIDLELAEPEEIEAKPVAEATVLEAPSEIDPDLLEEVNTKLDLARAYLEMGDKEGAREILEEVVKEGDSQQKQQAQNLIASL